MRKLLRREAPSRVETEIDLGDRIAPLTAKINKRAKKLIVKVDPVAGRVLVTAPSKRSLPAVSKMVACAPIAAFSTGS